MAPTALRIASEDIAAGNVWVATGADGQLVGIVALASGEAPGTLDLDKLFIEPRHIRAGVGRGLLAHAIGEAWGRGAKRLTILADPNAAGSTSATALCGSERHPRMRCPAASCRSMCSGSIPGDDRHGEMGEPVEDAEQVIVPSAQIQSADSGRPPESRPAGVSSRG
jgi:hypothetical protein